MSYLVPPGLYAVGAPGPADPVLVTANYKMSFDLVRRALAGRSAWLLVLETYGINVWCAAGKGTFGTDEIVRRVQSVRLSEVVSHRTLVVPQLGAPGVAAHEVKRQCGFRVAYGPVRAADLPAFLDAGLKATPDMRRVRFPLRDRLAVVPVEVILGAKASAAVAVAFLLLSGLDPDGYSWTRVATLGVRSAALFLAACVGGVFFTAVLLPWLPGRALATKGACVGLAIFAAAAGVAWLAPGALGSTLSTAAWGLIAPVVASVVAMNYTGTTTYTSLSGVRREMHFAVPLQALAAVAGASLWIAGLFF
jgi:acetyl-CoA decarbonylase/synthase complex subunit gamma